MRREQPVGRADDLVIATTEVGYPGVLAPRKTIVDLAGLNERAFALEPFSAERLFTRHRPDLLYMPHQDYAEMNAAILAHPAMRGYDLYSKEELGTKHFGLALRRDSPHYAAMRRIMGEKQPVRAGPRPARPGRR